MSIQSQQGELAQAPATEAEETSRSAYWLAQLPADMAQGPLPEQYAALLAWFNRLHAARQAGQLQESTLPALRAAMGEAMGPETMQGRCWLKKHGYAGDFEIIDQIYRRVCSPHPVLRRWDEFFHAQGAPKAVRNRKTYFKQLVQEALAKHHGSQPLQVLNIASGPCRDVVEFFEKNPDAAVQFTCVDLDQNAINHAKNLCAPWLKNIQFIRANALRLRLQDSFDLVWSAGLLDYFDDRGFAALLTRFWDWARPGTGQVVVGNFNNDNPSRTYQEFGDWSLLHRSAADLLALGAGCGFSASAMRVDSEPEGVNLFLRVAVEY